METTDNQSEQSPQPHPTNSPINLSISPAVSKGVKCLKLRQGPATNQLARTNSKNSKADPVTGIATLRRENIAVSIQNFHDVRGLTQSANKTFDVLMMCLTETGGRKESDYRSVELSLDTYMEMRGLTDKKETRAQVKSDLKSLENVKISFEDKRTDKKYSDFLDIPLCGLCGVANGIIRFEFHPAFLEIIKAYSLMDYPLGLLKFNDNANPNSYNLGRRTLEHRRTNWNKGNADLISVGTLLEACPSIPKYEDIMEKGQIGQRIIKPFERDMDACKDLFEWRYVSRGGHSPVEEESKPCDYHSFRDRLIRISWKIEFHEQISEISETRLDSEMGSEKPKN